MGFLINDNLVFRTRTIIKKNQNFVRPLNEIDRLHILSNLTDLQHVLSVQSKTISL